MLNFWIVIAITVLALLSTIFFFVKAYFRGIRGIIGSMIIFIFSLGFLAASFIARGKEHPTAFYFGLGAWLFLFVLGLITSHSKKE